MRVALVTGGSRGIGRAIALALSDAGMAVAVAARSEASLKSVVMEIEKRGGRTVASKCDVTSSGSVAAAFARVRETLGPVDILINNAGTAEGASILKLDESHWDREIAVNLTGTYLCTRAALPDMVARGFGRVINIASVAARIGFPYTSAYCAAKHGVLGFTRAVALEMATKGVTVNAICPGWVDSEMTDGTIARIAEKTGRTTEQARQELERKSPQQRLIQPDEVAAVAVFLASDAAHGITGQAIDVDGGEVMA
jgi:3-hydroxybutyrate dehydrogenase